MAQQSDDDITLIDLRGGTSKNIISKFKNNLTDIPLEIPRFGIKTYHIKW